jgi:hypothetical protein
MPRRRRRFAQDCAFACVITVLAGCRLGATTSPAQTNSGTSPASSTAAMTSPAAPPTRTSPASLPTRTSPASPRYPGCHARGDPRAGANTPIRLIVRSRCIRVRGIAGCIHVDKGDGDTHIALLLSAKDAKEYLRPANRSWTCNSDQGSDTAPRLVVEVIPQRCTVRPDNCADRGHFTDPHIPKNGQHVTITGPWVQDTSTFHGRTLWSEIHPAWRITADEDDRGVPVQNGGGSQRDGGD